MSSPSTMQLGTPPPVLKEVNEFLSWSASMRNVLEQGGLISKGIFSSETPQDLSLLRSTLAAQQLMLNRGKVLIAKLSTMYTRKLLALKDLQLIRMECQLGIDKANDLISTQLEQLYCTEDLPPLPKNNLERFFDTTKDSPSIKVSPPSPVTPPKLRRSTTIGVPPAPVKLERSGKRQRTSHESTQSPSEALLGLMGTSQAITESCSSMTSTTIGQ